MLFALLLGAFVAAASFAALEFIVVPRFRQFTLPALLLAVGGGLALALVFPTPLLVMYQMAWMLTMMVCVMLGFSARARRRQNKS